MGTESHRITSFPAPGQTANREDVNARRQAQFPGGIWIQKLLLLEPDGHSIKGSG
jgi:hypothetical protein